MTHNTKKAVFLVLILAVIAFIWIQSCIPKSASASESMFFGWLLGIDHNILRKIAHFSEFAMLGVFSALFAHAATSETFIRTNIAKSLVHGLFVALIDETIQIFSGRGPLVSDIWLDFSGFVCGFFVCMAIIHAVCRMKKKE